MLLEGQRTNLRDFELPDLDALAHWLAPGQRWQELDGPYYPRSTPEEVETLINRLRSRIAAAEWQTPRGRLAIARRADNLLLGIVSWYWIGEETLWAAAGIVLYDPAVWGKGIGYEALGLWSQYLFDSNLAWVRLDLRTWSGNSAMMRLAQKLGYREEARFRKARMVNGAYYDGMGYGILREEWTAQFPQGFAAHLHSKQAEDKTTHG